MPSKVQIEISFFRTSKYVILAQNGLFGVTHNHTHTRTLYGSAFPMGVEPTTLKCYSHYFKLPRTTTSRITFLTRFLSLLVAHIDIQTKMLLSYLDIQIRFKMSVRSPPPPQAREALMAALRGASVKVPPSS